MDMHPMSCPGTVGWQVEDSEFSCADAAAGRASVSRNGKDAQNMIYPTMAQSEAGMANDCNDGGMMMMMPMVSLQGMMPMMMPQQQKDASGNQCMWVSFPKGDQMQQYEGEHTQSQQRCQLQMLPYVEFDDRHNSNQMQMYQQQAATQSQGRRNGGGGVAAEQPPSSGGGQSQQHMMVALTKDQVMILQQLQQQQHRQGQPPSPNGQQQSQQIGRAHV